MFVLLSLVLQLILVVAIHHKNKRRLLVEIVGTLAFTMPALNKWRVLTNTKMEGHEIMPPVSEMMMFKGVEVFAESIPVMVLQVGKVLTSEKLNIVILLAMMSSIVFVSEAVGYLTFMKDINAESRRTGKLFYGFIPLSGMRLLIVKGSMYVASELAVRTPAGAPWDPSNTSVIVFLANFFSQQQQVRAILLPVDGKERRDRVIGTDRRQDAGNRCAVLRVGSFFNVEGGEEGFPLLGSATRDLELNHKRVNTRYHKSVSRFYRHATLPSSVQNGWSVRSERATSPTKSEATSINALATHLHGAAASHL